MAQRRAAPLSAGAGRRLSLQFYVVGIRLGVMVQEFEGMRRSPVLFFCLPSCQFGLQLPDPRFGRQSTFLFGQPCFSFGQSAFPLLLEGGDFLPGLRVVPAKLPRAPHRTWRFRTAL